PATVADRKPSVPATNAAIPGFRSGAPSVPLCAFPVSPAHSPFVSPSTFRTALDPLLPTPDSLFRPPPTQNSPAIEPPFPAPSKPASRSPHGCRQTRRDSISGPPLQSSIVQPEEA